jgi:hypothetical protein
MKKKATLIVLLITIFSCQEETKEPQMVDVPAAIIEKNALLKKSVLNELQIQDSFKLKTAQFFLDNLKYQKNYTGLRHDTYTNIITKYAQNQDAVLANITQIKDQLPPDIESYDVLSTDKNKLIENINQTYKTYLKCGWKDKISFETYCQYLLPHKIEKEPFVTNWKAYLQTQFVKENGESIFNTNITLATTQIHKWLYSKKNRFKVLYGNKNLRMPDLSADVLDKLQVGSCHEISSLGVAYMRALGIPATNDFAPTYLNLNSGHDWSTVIVDSLHCIPFDMTYHEVNKIKRDYCLFSKVYRKTYTPTVSSHLIQRGFCSFLPDLFNNAFIKDVTHLYTNTTTVEIPITKSIDSKIKFCYLGVFNRGVQSWDLVSWGNIKNGQATFKNVGTGGVYLAIAVEKEGSFAINSPFLLDTKGKIKFLTPDASQLETIKLNRKFNSDIDKENQKRKMIGGIFQGASNPEFLNPVTLYTITKNPGEYFNDVEISKGLLKSFQYVRYLSPKNSFGYVAEIEFYDNKMANPLKGKTLGNSGSYQDDPKCTKEAAFDGNVLTYVDAKKPDYSWVGLDLGSKKEISKIRFMARNDLNGVQIGNVYELFYWQDSWKSLGKKTATTTFLVYENVPKNAVLWLRNWTEGTEERIFTYENSKQVWW